MGELVHMSPGEVRWVRLALATPISKMPDPGRASDMDQLFRLLFLSFTGSPFRSARFLEAP